MSGKKIYLFFKTTGYLFTFAALSVKLINYLIRKLK
jgi:hypothetical protein